MGLDAIAVAHKQDVLAGLFDGHRLAIAKGAAASLSVGGGQEGGSGGQGRHTKGQGGARKENGVKGTHWSLAL